MKSRLTLTIIVGLILALGFSGWDTSSVASGKKSFTTVQLQTDSAYREKPVAPEKNPPGDIPDNQVFVKYVSSRGGYELDVPEGWARTTRGTDVRFTDKLDGVSVTITNAPVPPDTVSVRKNQAELVKKTGRAVQITHIQKIELPKGTAVRMAYESNSEPNSVTNKQVRLKNSTYFYYKNGKLAAVRLWAPLGADNIDQWNRIANSFRWR